MPGKRIGYIRCSSESQNTARQDEQLAGLHLDKIFTDKLSGKTLNRPALTQLLEYVREDDLVIITSMDRLARNVVDLRNLVRQITDIGASIEFKKEQLTFTGEDDSMSQLMLTMMGAVAEFEVALLRERQREGIAIAKAKGDVYKGRTKALKPSQVEELKTQVTAGIPKATVARNFGISRKSLYNYLGEG
jgi:DNA invertase Pin-like site-specific DNA recombinase